MNKDLEEKAQSYHKNLPEKIKKYLNERGISDEILNKHLIGWNGQGITIPIPNRTGEIIFFKCRKDPDDISSKGKYWYDPAGAHAELYGWENIISPKEPYLIMCEGELDRLALESKGIPAITNTSGAGTFKKEWLKELAELTGLYICYDNDERGFHGAGKRLEELPKAKMIRLPDMPDGKKKKDITDFFILGNTREDFIKLLKQAKTLEEVELEEQLRTCEDYVFFNPSQDFIKGTGYFTNPVLLPSKDPRDKEPVRQIFLVVTSDRKMLILDNKRDFYEKHGLLVNAMPPIKNPSIRWGHKQIKEFINGYRPDPIKTYQNIRAIYQKYSEFKEEGWYTVMPLWTMGTYIHQNFEAYPYLGILGLPGTGKSKTARYTARMAYNGIVSVGISEATLFRDVESLRCTLVIDEGDELNDPKKNQTLRALLNAGHSKGASVGRQESTKSGGFYSRYYEVYSPKIIVNTKGLEDVLNSRAITIIMLRAMTNRGRVIDTETSEDWAGIRHELYSFALYYFPNIQDIYLKDPEISIANNRYNDLWIPILSIGKFIFKDNPDEMDKLKSFANEQINRSADISLDDWTMALLKVLRDMVTADGEYPNHEIKEKMKDYLEAKDVDDRMKPSWIGYKLKGFGLHKKIKQSKGVVYYFKKSEIDDLMKRYLEPAGL
ncbi:MAG: toprim domain-containing protein [Candidatus Omnitrophota bacterium]|nr:toprim domain-containing protein [Candidatus Omnitrophota bacterium]